MHKYLLLILFVLLIVVAFGQEPIQKTQSTDSLVTKLQSSQELKVYPNPVTDYFYFDYSTSFTTNIKLQVYNTLGKVVISKELNDKQGVEKVYVTDLEKGLYFCSLIVDDNRVLTKKIIINR